ncbi:hypothetical protein Clacol_003043 [Clathrus columnatus]|uniref:Uncharacterized protein n=1 Tax=Clathrus columnatus TaxID=1419009 RepID=A0AAV5A6E9_9AGAM|nr:hypothetical protein Clacol_003043 [Clathrus columnatus]
MQVTVTSVFIAILFASASLTRAVNDQPCVSGECTWSGGDNSGPHGLIGDVTPAAGWNIQGCDPNWSSGTHSVQMCGKGPFARIIGMNKMNDSNGTYLMDMDYHLSHISPSRGSVNFSLTVGDGFNTGNATLQTRDVIQSPNMPFTLQKSGTLLSKSLSCSLGDNSASLGIEADGSSDISGYIIFGGVVSGTIIPPEVSEFKLITTMSGSGSIDFELDASITVAAKVDVDFDLQTKASITAQLDLTLIQLVLPPSEGQSIAVISPGGSNPVHFSFNPGSTSLDGTVTGHIIPKINFGISVLEDIASANVRILFFNINFLDSIINYDIQIFLQSDLSANVGATLQRQNKRDHPRGFMKRQNNQACISSEAAVDVSAGVSGSIGPLSGDLDNISIYSNSFPLFQASSFISACCLKREVEKRQDDDLQCPTPSEIAASLQSLL